jgi:hypothetical protein
VRKRLHEVGRCPDGEKTEVRVQGVHWDPLGLLCSGSHRHTQSIVGANPWHPALR